MLTSSGRIASSRFIASMLAVSTMVAGASIALQSWKSAKGEVAAPKHVSIRVLPQVVIQEQAASYEQGTDIKEILEKIARDHKCQHADFGRVLFRPNKSMTGSDQQDNRLMVSMYYLGMNGDKTRYDVSLTMAEDGEPIHRKLKPIEVSCPSGPSREIPAPATQKLQY